jgi:uncharacterized protein (DUF697 family)
MPLVSVSSNPEVSRLVETCGYAAAALTILPIPGSEIIGVMPLHVGMVVGIAHHRGRTITQESASGLLLQIGATVGLSLVGSRVATTAAKIVFPGFGGLVAAPFMYASTLAIGAVSDQFFANEGALSEDEMRRVYQDALKSARSTFRADRMRDPEAMRQAEGAVHQAKAPEAAPAPEPTGTDRLRKAKEMLDQGLITQEEFDAVKARILADL